MSLARACSAVAIIFAFHLVVTEIRTICALVARVLFVFHYLHLGRDDIKTTHTNIGAATRARARLV